MNADDPRHGRTEGFHAGCREECCRRAIARYQKGVRLRKARGTTWAIPAVGAQRRIQALMALGWTSSDIATAAEWNNRNDVLRILNGQKGKPTKWVERTTHNTICRVFEQLAMHFPAPAAHRARTRAMALRKGYAPPLAWDNIDDPREIPQGIDAEGRNTSIKATRVHALEHLVRMGDNLEAAAKALGISTDAIWAWCKRNDHLDLYERLAERSRTQDNQHTKGAAA